MASGAWTGEKATNGSQQLSVDRYSTFSLSCSSESNTLTDMVSVGVRNLSISWQAPTENVDGSTLVDLAGFRLYSVSDSDYALEADIPSATANSITLAKPPGTYDFVMTAYDSEGDESAYSNAVTKLSPWQCRLGSIHQP